MLTLGAAEAALFFFAGKCPFEKEYILQGEYRKKEIHPTGGL
jgi:hypothetical protein